MKEEKNTRNKWLHLRLDDQEYELLTKRFKKTTEPNLSSYARKIILGKPMIRAVRNQSLHEILITLIQLQKDLNGIGNNYNQMVHKLHLLDKIPEFRIWVSLYEKEKISIAGSIEEVKQYVSKTAEKWLQ